MNKFLTLLMLAGLVRCAHGATVAYWDFEDGVDGQAFNPGIYANGSTGSVDTVSGTLMRGYDEITGPSFTGNTHAFGGALAMNLLNNSQDAYVTEGPLHNWSPTNWTIECQVYLEEFSGWETMIGRDGTTQGSAESDFYLSNNGIDDRFRINIATEGGQRWILDGDYTVELYHWYGLAAMSDGAELSLWLDDGTGYQKIGSTNITAQSVADNALPGSTLTWTFGRGWYSGSNVDRIDGKMDNVRFSDSVLSSGELLPVPLQTNAPPQEPDLANVTNETVYLMCYHEGPYPSGGSSGVFLSWSTNGYDFYSVNDGHPVFVPPEFPGDDSEDANPNLVRDPSIVYGPDGLYHLVFTSAISSRSFGYAESPDLVHWSNVKLVQIWQNEPESIDHTWAPEIFYDAVLDQYMIAFSSGVGGNSIRIWYTTTTDFENFTDPAVMYWNAANPTGEQIDGFVAGVATNHYIMAYKDNAQIWVLDGSSPTGPWVNGRQATAGGDEGPALLKIGDTWHLYYDNYGQTDDVFGMAVSTDTTNWTDVTGLTDLPAKADVPDYNSSDRPPHHCTVFEAPLSTLGAFTTPLQDNVTNLTYLIHRWSFNDTAGSVMDGAVITDSVSGAVAEMVGNRAVFSGTGLQLPGDTTGTGDAAYLDLPNGTISSLTNLTVEIWATPVSSKSWQRLFSFGRTVETGDGGGEWTGPAPGGTSADDVLFWSINQGSVINQQRLAMLLDGGATSQSDTGMDTTTGTQYHYVFTFEDGIGFFGASGGRMTFYRDGLQIGWRDVSFRLQDIEDVNNWLGRSQWSGDSNSNVEYNEVRIFSEALGWYDIYGDYLAGPDVTMNQNPGLYLDVGDGMSTLTWPGNVVGLTLEHTDELSNTWTKVTNTMVNSTSGLQVVLPLSNGSEFYRLGE